MNRLWCRARWLCDDAVGVEDGRFMVPCLLLRLGVGRAVSASMMKSIDMRSNTHKMNVPANCQCRVVGIVPNVS